MADENPLTEAHYQQLQDGIAKAELALRMVAQAKRADIDTGDVEQRASETLDRLRKLKNVYFPNR